ncbi:MAG TPA: IS110 family transposase [Dissulfurispiraceae bacterium]
MSKYSKHVGLDVHKETIVVAIAKAGRGEAVHYGEITNTPEAIQKVVRKISAQGERVLFVYEAGPCGYGIYRQLRDLGYECMVVAPSLIPKKAGDRIKTDQRDALTLARLSRAGELTGIWVPDTEQEAVRDLTRAREDMKTIERHARQRLGAFLLRHGRRYPGKSAWTLAHFRWLEGLCFEHPSQQIVFQEYVDTVKHAQRRVTALEQQMHIILEQWSLGKVATALMALRGVNTVTAMTILAELGDISRFESPRQLMAYLGLVPSEHSSGQKQKRGGITKSGNGHVRRVLVEASWCYRFPARKTAALQRRAEKTSEKVQAIAWKAQKRLCMRYRHLSSKGKRLVEVCTAVARELAGFIWAIACEAMRGHNTTTMMQAA